MVVETNSSILHQMQVLEDETVKKDISADIWTNASRFYYSIGKMKDTLMPTIVKYFGDYKVFNSIFKPVLDKFVNKLQDEGIDSTVYFDE